jgi:hypothetical protein
MFFHRIGRRLRNVIFNSWLSRLSLCSRFLQSMSRLLKRNVLQILALHQLLVQEVFWQGRQLCRSKLRSRNSLRRSCFQTRVSQEWLR